MTNYSVERQKHGATSCPPHRYVCIYIMNACQIYLDIMKHQFCLCTFVSAGKSLKVLSYRKSSYLVKQIYKK